MPIVNSVMYAEGRKVLHRFDELNVLILGGITNDPRAFAIQIDTLHHYLIDTVASDITIQLHCTSIVANNVAQSLNITQHDTIPTTNEELLTAVNDLDIDVVFDQNNQFNQKFFWSKFYEFEAVKTIEDLRNSIENYLIGSGITWSFTRPLWNMPLPMKYMATPGICMDYFDFMAKCTGIKKYTDNQKEKVRYITNKIKQIEFSRDILQYYVKRMRKARRNGMPDDDYNLELNYHLSNYYFLMAGTLDTVSRLMNDVYKLGLKRPQLAIEKVEFINANRKKRTGFVSLLTKKEFVDWISWLKERRNFVAHDGDIRQTPLVEAKKTPLTDDEINAIVDQQIDWTLMAANLPTDLYQAQREQAIQLARIQHGYKVIAEKIMMVPEADGGHKIYFPLLDIDLDYEKFADLMTKILYRLKK